MDKQEMLVKALEELATAAQEGRYGERDDINIEKIEEDFNEIMEQIEATE